MCEKCQMAASLIREWAAAQGHDACWYYPELFAKLAQVFGVNVTLSPPSVPRDEFRDGCQRFEEQVYIGSRNHDDGMGVG